MPHKIRSEGRFRIKMPSYQYRNSHYIIIKHQRMERWLIVGEAKVHKPFTCCTRNVVDVLPVFGWPLMQTRRSRSLYRPVAWGLMGRNSDTKAGERHLGSLKNALVPYTSASVNHTFSDVYFFQHDSPTFLAIDDELAHNKGKLVFILIE